MVLKSSRVVQCCSMKLTKVDNVCYDMNNGEEENGPSNQLVKLDALVERK